MEPTFVTKSDHKILRLLPYGDPLLRTQAQTLKFPPSDDEIELIKNMLYSVEEPQLKAAKAPWSSAAGMAAPQWGFSKRIFVNSQPLLCWDFGLINKEKVVCIRMKKEKRCLPVDRLLSQVINISLIVVGYFSSLTDREAALPLPLLRYYIVSSNKIRNLAQQKKIRIE